MGTQLALSGRLDRSAARRIYEVIRLQSVTLPCKARRGPMAMTASKLIARRLRQRSVGVTGVSLAVARVSAARACYFVRMVDTGAGPRLSSTG